MRLVQLVVLQRKQIFVFMKQQTKIGLRSQLILAIILLIIVFDL